MKNFKSLLLASVLFTSAVSFASEAPAAPKVDAPVENKDVKKEDKAPEAQGWSAYISEKASAGWTATKSGVAYPFVKANEGCNYVNGKLFTLNAEDKGYGQMFKSNASQIVVVSTAVVLAAYATYAYVTKTDKKAKN